MSRGQLPHRFNVALFGLIALLAIISGRGAEAPSHFEQANRLYEQAKFSEAASLYESMIKAGRRSPEIFFNLGNAYFRQGQLGRALFNYLQAERTRPRDPDVQANLRFTRERVTGALSIMDPVWLRAVRYFTLDEITTTCTLLFWIWAGLVSISKWRPDLRLRLPVQITGSLLAAGVIVLLIAYNTSSERVAIVTSTQAPVHLGPLSESQVAYTVADGAELKALAQRADWLQVSDRTERSGWIYMTNVLIFQSRPAE